MFENWRKNSPFKEMLPEREDLLIHPIRSFWQFIDACVKNTNDNSQKVFEMREDKVNDIHKQNTWRKHHGIEDKQGIGPWMPAEEVLKLHDKRTGAADENHEGGSQMKKPVKRWFGIW